MNVLLSLLACGVLSASSEHICKPRKYYASVAAVTKHRRLMVKNACPTKDINDFVRAFCYHNCSFSGACVRGCGAWCHQYLPKGQGKTLALCEGFVSNEEKKCTHVLRTKAISHVMQTASFECSLQHVGLNWII